jgi:hypothetical protein
LQLHLKKRMLFLFTYLSCSCTNIDFVFHQVGLYSV